MPSKITGEGKESKRMFFKTSIDIPEKSRKSIVEILNQSLADATDLYTQTKFAHWNVKGSTFYMLHELFDDIAGGVLEWVDLIAERATALGGFAEGTARMAASATKLPEPSIAMNDGNSRVKDLAKSMSSFAESVRKAIDDTAELGDMSTSDLFTEVSRGADKYLWFLEAHFQ